MEIADSARKHGVSDGDMLHAARFAFAEVTEVARDDFVMLIGSDRSGRLLEVGILDPDDDPAIIHAMRLRPRFYRYLPTEG